MSPFASLREYERFIYTLQQQFPRIVRSTLAETAPHHKHIPPDIKHHRVPAAGFSFNAPNLLFLIQEIEAQLL